MFYRIFDQRLQEQRRKPRLSDAWVYVDGVLAVDNSGLHSPLTKTATLNLTGKNKIDVYFAERHTDRSHMSLSLTSPLVRMTPVKAGCKEKINLVATKIVCDEEAMLPNWGLGGANITSTTAADYVAAHEGCHLVNDWKFQWGYSGVTNVAGTHVGEADGSAGAGSNTGSRRADRAGPSARRLRRWRPSRRPRA